MQVMAEVVMEVLAVVEAAAAASLATAIHMATVKVIVCHSSSSR